MVSNWPCSSPLQKPTGENKMDDYTKGCSFRHPAWKEQLGLQDPLKDPDGLKIAFHLMGHKETCSFVTGPGCDTWAGNKCDK